MSERPIEGPDLHHVRAAQGWAELGNTVEAQKELENISPELLSHPGVLEVRWHICAEAKDWDAALEIASALAQSAPEHPTGWVHRSYTLHELKRTEEARDNLLRVVDRFPDDPIMRYNLACYECQLGRLPEARRWLKKAYQLGNPERIRQGALQDADLKPLWEEIRAEVL